MRPLVVSRLTKKSEGYRLLIPGREQNKYLTIRKQKEKPCHIGWIIHSWLTPSTFQFQFFKVFLMGPLTSTFLFCAQLLASTSSSSYPQNTLFHFQSSLYLVPRVKMSLFKLLQQLSNTLRVSSNSL